MDGDVHDAQRLLVLSVAVCCARPDSVSIRSTNPPIMWCPRWWMPRRTRERDETSGWWQRPATCARGKGVWQRRGKYAPRGKSSCRHFLQQLPLYLNTRTVSCHHCTSFGELLSHWPKMLYVCRHGEAACRVHVDWRGADFGRWRRVLPGLTACPPSPTTTSQSLRENEQSK